MKKISIALCTYNGAKFLPEQLESYLRQTHLPDELVVCDDCSKDETPQIIRNFAQKASFPVHLHINEKNLGSTKNFEKAIALCTGDLIFLSDQDDYWMTEKIEKIEAEFNKNEDVGLVFSDAALVDENLQPVNRRLWDHTFTPQRRETATKGKFFEALLSENFVNGATMAFRSELREKFMPIPDNIPNLIHDGWIALVIAGKAEVAFVSEPLIKYRLHSAQQLGIDYSSKLDFERRKSRFAKSVKINRDEKTRLDILERMFVANLSPSVNGSEFFNSLRAENREKVRHYESRMNLPQSKTKRFFPVFRELLTGRYHQFSKGFLSAMKDLLETW